MFKKAIPVWAQNESETLNSQIFMRAVVPDTKNAVLSVATAYFYRLWINGEFVAFGPARTAGGYARVDEIPIGIYGGGENEIVLEVAGYYCKSLSTAFQPNFITAEIVQNGNVVAATGVDGFDGFINCRRIRNVRRYTNQRHFTEVWDMRKTDVFADEYRTALVRVDYTVKYLDRRVPYPKYGDVAAECVSSGVLEDDKDFDRELFLKRHNYIHEGWGEFSHDGLFDEAFIDLSSKIFSRTNDYNPLPVTVGSGKYAVFDLKKIYAGFVSWDITANKDSRVLLAFSEYRTANDFSMNPPSCFNVTEILLDEGQNSVSLTFEPYSMRYVAVAVIDGSVNVNGISLKKYERDTHEVISRKINDPELKKIYDAAVRSFAHNAVDLYMDCPSRERAGWLCDSYFTAKAEYFLYGKPTVEDAFLENYRLSSETSEFDDGILPMCYPSDRPVKGAATIPQWSLWYVLEVCEYLGERNTKVDKSLFYDSVYGVLGWHEKYENSDGLLEKMPYWNFVEWSAANSWVQDVNFPTQFLYSAALEAAGQLYGDGDLIKRAARVRASAKKLSFNGKAFLDHAIRNEDGELELAPGISEAGQYYALLLGDIDLDAPEYAEFNNLVESDFENFDYDGTFERVCPFIGFYVKMLALMKCGKKELLRRSMIDFFGHMVDSTGTLWENKGHGGSHDHGFASLAAVAAKWADVD